MSPASASIPARAETSTFEVGVAEVFAELRAALAELVSRVRDPIRRAVDLERSLGLDKKLAWQVFRIVRSTGLSEVEHVPSPSSIRRLLAAAQSHRIPGPVTRRVSIAFDRFEEFVQLHGGDRAGLVSMISGAARGGIEQFELKVRKSLFRGNAHVYGVQAHTLVRTFVYHSRPGGRHYDDLVMVQADIGLQKLRDSQPLSISCFLKTSNSPPSEGNSIPTGTWRSQSDELDPGGPRPDMLTEFCSNPLPEMRPRSSGIGGVETELVFPTAGRTGAVTLYSSILMEDTREGESGTYFGKTLLTIPTEALVVEMLIPSGWTDPATARLGIYARRDLPEHVYEMRTADLLPQREAFTFLGSMEGSPAIDGAPDHPAAVRSVLTKRGWLGTRFDVFRCHMLFPVLHSMAFYGVDVAR